MMRLDIELDGQLIEKAAVADCLLGLAGELVDEGSIVGGMSVFALLCRCC